MSGCGYVISPAFLLDGRLLYRLRPEHEKKNKSVPCGQFAAVPFNGALETDVFRNGRQALPCAIPPLDGIHAANKYEPPKTSASGKLCRANCFRTWICSGFVICATMTARCSANCRMCMFHRSAS